MLARRIALAAGPALCVVLLSACTGAYSPAAPASAPAGTSTGYGPASSAASAPKAADATTLALKMADSSLGSILVDGKGMTLYMYTKDSPNTSVCTGQCLSAWPPLLGKPTMGAGVDAAKLGSSQRPDGSTQATYNGWPLYYWAGDTKPGDVSGQNVGGIWFVLDSSGNPVKK